MGQNINESTNRLIRDIISQDTIVSEKKFKSLKDKVLIGMLTKEDSAQYVRTIKERELLLYEYRSNTKASEMLREDLRNNGVITSSLSPEIVKKAIAQFPADRKFDFFSVDDKIQFTKGMNKWPMYHEFSSPVKMSKLIFNISLPSY